MTNSYFKSYLEVVNSLKVGNLYRVSYNQKISGILKRKNYSICLFEQPSVFSNVAGKLCWNSPFVFLESQLKTFPDNSFGKYLKILTVEGALGWVSMVNICSFTDGQSKTHPAKFLELK